MDKIKHIYLPYTICFCIQNNDVLMLYRNKNPNSNLWNGIGGKIESGETPMESIKREVVEESGLDVAIATNFYYAGIVSWKDKQNEEEQKGMYVFIASFPSDYPLVVRREIDEGRLAWKDINWVCDRNNLTVVENIPLFLPRMLEYNIPLLYQFHYMDKRLQNFMINSL